MDLQKIVYLCKIVKKKVKKYGNNNIRKTEKKGY